MHKRASKTSRVFDAPPHAKGCGRWLVMLSWLFPLVFAGCAPIGGNAVETIYYTLEYDPPGEKFRDLAPLPSSLRMERFTIAPDYDTERIVYRDASYTRGTFANHRWHASPELLVRSFLGRDLQAAGIFQAVFTDAATLGATHGLSGTIEEFLELEEDEGWQAVLTMVITFVDRRPGGDPRKKILFQKRFSARERASERTPQAFAKAMSLALRQVSEAITAAVKDTAQGGH